jgi:hypothetical protein
MPEKSVIYHYVDVNYAVLICLIKNMNILSKNIFTAVYILHFNPFYNTFNNIYFSWIMEFNCFPRNSKNKKYIF